MTRSSDPHQGQGPLSKGPLDSFAKVFIPPDHPTDRAGVDHLDGFIRIDLADYIGENRSFVSSPEYDNGIEVDYYLSEEKTLAARIHFTERSMGPPQYVHGGAMSAVLDEAMGIACWFKDLPVLTRTMTINYLRMLPVGTKVFLETEVNSDNEGDVVTEARLKDALTGKVFATATGRYARLDSGRISRLGMVHLSNDRGR